MVFGLDDMAVATIGSGILQGGSSLLGGILGSGQQSATNAQQMAFNAQQAQANRDWQEHMSNTAYQRAMADMRAAGLNPILAANLGGASTPGGGQGSVTLGNPGEVLSRGISGAGGAIGHSAQVKAALNQADKDAAQTDVNKTTSELNKATTTRTEQDTRTGAANEDAAKAAAERSRSDTIVNNATVGLIHEQTNSAREKAIQDGLQTQDQKTYGVPSQESPAGLARRILRKALPGAIDGAGQVLAPSNSRTVPTPNAWDNPDKVGPMGGPAAGQKGSVYNRIFKGEK